MNSQQSNRSQALLYGVLCLVTIALGLASRSTVLSLPEFVATYAGDTLWAMMVFWLLSALRPNWKIHNVAMLAFAFAVTIELTQLYHAPWIDEIRGYRLGGLILGFGFKASDLLCYTAGVLLGGAIRWILVVVFFRLQILPSVGSAE